MVNVVINDYVNKKRVKLLFLPGDFDVVREQWYEISPTLSRLQSLELFEGRTRWCELTPTHFRLLVAKGLLSASFLEEEERLNDDNPVVSSLNFMICMMIFCIEEQGECQIELLRINRVGEMDLAVEYTAAMQMEPNVSPPKHAAKRNKFSVAVDNTK